MTVNRLGSNCFYFVILIALVRRSALHDPRVRGQRTFLSSDPAAGRDRDSTGSPASTSAASSMLDHLYGQPCCSSMSAGFLILYGCMRLQAGLPLNPAEQSAVASDLSLNTAVSFTTNTNWQNYGGESTMSLLHADARPDVIRISSRPPPASRSPSRSSAALRAHSMQHRRQFLGRSHPRYFLCPACRSRPSRAVPHLAGYSAESRPPMWMRRRLKAPSRA